MALPTCPKSGEAFLRELKRTAWVFRAQILFVSGLSSPPPHSLEAKVLTIVFWANSHVRPPTPELGGSPLPPGFVSHLMGRGGPTSSQTDSIPRGPLPSLPGEAAKGMHFYHSFDY